MHLKTNSIPFTKEHKRKAHANWKQTTPKTTEWKKKENDEAAGMDKVLTDPIKIGGEKLLIT